MPARDAATPVQLPPTPAYRAKPADLGPLADDFAGALGYVLDDPISVTSSFAVTNGGVEGFVRAAALNLGRGVRINAVSPGLAEDSYEQLACFNPGRLPVPMCTIGAAFVQSVEG